MKKIGFLGGTFNPIHNAHLRIAIEVQEYCKLDTVHFVPVFKPVHKGADNLLPFEVREQILKIAFHQLTLDDIFHISTHESTMDCPCYTYNSLQTWQKIHNVKPYFIIGLEDFVRLDTWHKGLELPKLAHFIVVNRSHLGLAHFHFGVDSLWGSEAEKLSEYTYSLYDSIIEYIETSFLEISSTHIRNSFLASKNVSCLLPSSVQDYILRNSDIIKIWEN